MSTPAPILHKTPHGMVTVRPAVASDDALLGPLRKEALTNAPTAFGADLAYTAPFEPGYWADKIRKDSEAASGLIVVAAYTPPANPTGAMAAETLVGMMGIYRGHGKGRHAGGLWGVYVQPEFRGLRLPDDMLALCLIWAKDLGLRLVKLAVSADNPIALRVYLRQGFKLYGIEPALIHHAGVDVDGLWMAKWL